MSQFPKTIQEFDKAGASTPINPWKQMKEGKLQEKTFTAESEIHDRAEPRFRVRRNRASGGFRVWDSRDERFVDGPFRDREDAEARAAKREIRDS